MGRGWPNSVKLWRAVSLILLVLLFFQYVYYGFQQMLYEQSVAALHKKTTELDQLKLDIMMLQSKVNNLEDYDRRLLAKVEANRISIEREVDMVEQRLPKVKTIKKIN